MSASPTVPPGASGPVVRVPYRKVLVAADVGAHRPTSLGPALKLLELFGAEGVLCHVVMRSTSAPGNETDGAPANPEETEIVRTLRSLSIAELGEQRGRELPIKILHGDAGQRICEYAEYAHCDLIIVGPRERGSIAKSLRGSVSKYVVANTRRAVLVLGA